MKRNLFKFVIIAFATFLTVGCQNNAGGNQGGGDGAIDYTESEEVRLKLDYVGHDFYTDGIGQVTLKSPIDGDTAHFHPVVTKTSQKIIKSRFWGIDTPESTGRIEEYGAEASDFTTEKLEEANKNGTIVVSTARSDYGEPSADSTGERFVSLIWVSLTKKNAPFNELKLLNLWIVQEGLSYVKNVTDIPDYQPIFIAAEKQAKDLKLNLFSGKPAGKFNYGDYETTSLLDLKHDIEKAVEKQDLGEKSLVGAKVRVTGTVSGFSDGTLFLQNFYTVEEGGNGNIENPYSHEKGEYAGINIFCGMSSVPSKYTTPGTYIDICGTVTHKETFGYQLTGAEGHFPIVESLAEDDDCHIILKAENNTEEYQLFTFEYSASTLNAHISSQDIEVKYENFYCSTHLAEAVECTRFYKSDAGDITLTFGTNKFQAYLTSIYKGNPNNNSEYWNVEEKFVGKSFYISGVFSAFTGGTTPRFQFVFTNPSAQLLCTDYYNADGSVK